MLAGAGGIDIAMLIVAADEGVMPQTEEHLEILSLLDIRKGVIALTKTDMVDEEWLEMMKEEVREKMQGTFMEDAKIIPVSSYTGDGVPELQAELEEREYEISAGGGAAKIKIKICARRRVILSMRRLQWC